MTHFSPIQSTKKYPFEIRYLFGRLLNTLLPIDRVILIILKKS